MVGVPFTINYPEVSLKSNYLCEVIKQMQPNSPAKLQLRVISNMF
jgi:hypothetical protein